MLLTAKGAHNFLNSGYVHVDRGILAGQQQAKVFSDRGSLTLGAVSDRVRTGGCLRAVGVVGLRLAIRPDRPMRSPPGPRWASSGLVVDHRIGSIRLDGLDAVRG